MILVYYTAVCAVLIVGRILIDKKLINNYKEYRRQKRDIKRLWQEFTKYAIIENMSAKETTETFIELSRFLLNNYNEQLDKYETAFLQRKVRNLLEKSKLHDQNIEVMRSMEKSPERFKIESRTIGKEV